MIQLIDNAVRIVSSGVLRTFVSPGAWTEIEAVFHIELETAEGIGSLIRNGRTSCDKLVTNSLHIFEQNLLSAAVIKLGGPAVCVARDSLRGFKGAVIFQKIRDPGRPE